MDDKLRTLFKVGQKYTLYDLSSFAITFKKEIQITEYFDGNPVYKYRGKRKKFILQLETRDYSSAPLKALKSADLSNKRLRSVSPVSFGRTPSLNWEMMGP